MFSVGNAFDVILLRLLNFGIAKELQYPEASSASVREGEKLPGLQTALDMTHISPQCGRSFKFARTGTPGGVEVFRRVGREGLGKWVFRPVSLFMVEQLHAFGVVALKESIAMLAIISAANFVFERLASCLKTSPRGRRVGAEGPTPQAVARHDGVTAALDWLV